MSPIQMDWWMWATFNQLKQALVSAPILAYPDFREHFRLYVDASNDAFGIELGQIQTGKEAFRYNWWS